MGQALGKDSVKYPPSSNRCPAKAPQGISDLGDATRAMGKTFHLNFHLGNKQCFALCSQLKQERRSQAHAALCRQHGLSMAEHCLELPPQAVPGAAFSRGSHGLRHRPRHTGGLSQPDACLSACQKVTRDKRLSGRNS